MTIAAPHNNIIKKWRSTLYTLIIKTSVSKDQAGDDHEVLTNESEKDLGVKTHAKCGCATY